jgi:hypothetical protein
MDHDEIGWGDVNCINLAQDEDGGGHWSAR